MSFLNGNKTPIGYGAIMYNGSAGAGIDMFYPFFTSQADIGTLTAIAHSGASGTISISDIDDYWSVMPGYKLEVYNNPSYTTILLTGDNTNGTTPTSYKISTANAATSIKLYYKNVLINQPNPVRVSATNFANTYIVTYNSINYRVYEYYAGSTGTLSFSASSTISSVECLLIGGGGSGAHNNGANIGVGGGGAGAFLSSTIPVTAGDTFTINVGAGGAVPSLGFAGNVGSGTSIQRTTGGNPSTLTAGGGGGGGGGGGAAGGGVTSTANYQGTKGTIWGSTGGVCPYLSTITTAFTTSASNAFTQTSAVFGTVTSSVFAGGSVTYQNYMGGAFYAGASGGGGAGGVGDNNGGTNTASGGAGGAGKAWALTGSRLFAGGGGGLLAPIGVGGTSNGAAGSGGGGAYQVAVTENTGSGGGAGHSTNPAGKGANGICIIAVPV